MKLIHNLMQNTIVFLSVVFTLSVLHTLASFTLLAQGENSQQYSEKQSAARSALDIQIPFDSEGKLWIITEELERQYRFFPQYPNLIDARLYQQADSSFVLEIAQLVDSVPENTRLRLSLADFIELRHRVNTALNAGGYGSLGNLESTRLSNEYVLSDVEKISLGLSTITLGLAYGLIADLLSINTNSAQASASTMTIATPLAFGAGSFWAISQPWFNRSSSLMLTNGLTVGFIHGIAAYIALANPSTLQGTLAGVIGIAGSIAESALTLHLPAQWNLSYGQTSMITSMGASSLLTGALSSIALGILGFDNQGTMYPDALRWTAALSLAGSAGGYILGYRLGQIQHIAAGDNSVFSAPSNLLTLLPISLAIPSLVLNNANMTLGNIRLLAAATIGAQVAGYALGYAFIDKKDFSFEQGQYIDQATALGSSLGLIPFYTGLRSDILFYTPLLSTLGGAAGFAIAYLHIAQQAEQNDKNRRNRTGLFSMVSSDTSDYRLLYSDNLLWLHRFFQRTKITFSPLGILSAFDTHLGIAQPAITISTCLVTAEQDQIEHQRALLDYLYQ
ncbi:MAG: hypothetical protein RML40_03475 [Bacteroidota bacterium]|nr:hypothetical protein [Candidatus Kapabacteria bacterium]MDW8219571.1 hypothetical protein [Bacteroidota bacterium]